MADRQVSWSLTRLGSTGLFHPQFKVVVLLGAEGIGEGVAGPIAPQCVHMPLDGARVNLVELMELEFMARKLNLWPRRPPSNRREENPGSEGTRQRAGAIGF